MGDSVHPGYASLDLAPFRHLPALAWSEDLYRVDEALTDLVDRHAARLLAEHGGGVAPDRREPALRLAARLAGRTPAGSDDLDARIAALRHLAAGTFDLVERAAAVYPAWLRGDPGPEAALLGPGAAGLWERYFSNDNLPYAAVNGIAAFAADRRAAGRPLSVLEVGGGCGSAAEALLERIASRLVEYRFTDVQPWFLRRGEDLLRRRFPGVPLSVGRLDLDRDLGEQGVGPASFDLVHAVNTLHVARPVAAALERLRGALRPGGVLALGEGVRPRPGRPAAIEFVFELSPRFGRFLHWREWRDHLEAAGFREVAFEPDPEAAHAAHPDFSMSAVTAIR